MNGLFEKYSGNSEGLARLVPRCRSPSIEEGLKAKTKDPLWFLARQWQLGEFEAMNRGRPVNVEVSANIAGIEQVSLKENDPFAPIADRDLPLECLVEGTMRDAPDVRLAKAWDTQRLEYKFRVKAGGAVLEAKEYYGSSLEWYDFRLSGGAAGQGTDKMYNVAPARAGFKGMPNSRWWQFEDCNVDLGDISRPNLNFLSMLLIEFGMIYSQDWYVMPLQQDTGSLRLLKGVKVKDSFGNVTDIGPITDTSADESLWSMFSLSGPDKAPSPGSKLLMLPNTVVQPQEGEPIEEVTIARDEIANMAWAIERKYLSSSVVVNRDDVESVNTDTQIPPSSNGRADVYRLMSHVARNWIPYVPVRVSDDRGIVFRRGRTDPLSNKNDPQFKGLLLEGSVIINEEEIPATPIKLTRYYKLASVGPEDWSLVNSGGVWKLVRADSRKVKSWLANTKEPDNRQASSDVKFDYIAKRGAS